MKKTHFNGGIEQAFLQLANEDNLLSDADKKRLDHLQGLPQNRVEENHQHPKVLTPKS